MTTDTDRDLARQLADVRAEIGDIKRALQSSASAASLPLVELLLKDNARRREAEEQLAQAQAWMQVAQENGGVAAYRYDIVEDQLFWSPSTYSLYGLSQANDRASMETWLQAVHPGDHQRVLDHATAAIEIGAPVDQEYRIVLGTGETRWIKDRGRVEVDATGRPLRVVGMNIDITGLKETQAALAESEAQFRYTFEHARAGVAHVGLDGRFLRVNSYLCELLGRSADELMASTFQEITHPDDLAADLANVERMLAGEIDVYTIEKRYVRPGGEVVWTDLSVSLRRHEDGTPANFISVVVDTREKKLAEERLRLIMGELSHRSKNALTVIQSAIRLSSKHAVTAVELRDAITDRLHGMSASQDLLIGGQAGSASVRTLIEAQMAIFLPPDTSRIDLIGPPVSLRAEAVHAIGLAIHELATNACKHGALSGEAGGVRIEWQLAAGGDLRLVWREFDGPPVAQPERSGFGRRILERTVELSLGATASIEFDPAGLIWTLVVPSRFIDTD